MSAGGGAARISRILSLQDRYELTGRELAALLRVHEGTISRDLKFIEGVRAGYRSATGCEMTARSFRWSEGGRGWETTFEMRDGRRVR